MKKIYTFLAAVLFAATVFGQAPESFKYQAVLRDVSGNIKANANVSIEIAILQGSATGTEVFNETHSTTTNDFGLVNLEVGSVNTGDFPLIDWTNGPYFVKITVDGTEMGTSQLLSVPYALYAKTTENVDDGDADNSNELQTLSLSNDTLSLSSGNSIALPYDSSGWGRNGDTIYYNSGNIGIGTASPSEILEIETPGGNSLQYAARLTNLDNTDNGGSATGILFSVEAFEDLSKGAFVYERKSTYARGDFHFLQNDATDLTDPSLSDAVVTIKNDGNVGIGTMDPGSKLDVSGSATISGDLSVGEATVLSGDLNVAGSTAISKLTVAGSTVISDLDVSGSATISGNVGIGIALPGEKLEVNGHALAMPLIGQWYPSASLANQNGGTYATIKLNVEAYNTNPDYFTRNQDSLGITINIAGYYEIVARTLVLVSVGDYGHFFLMKNSVRIETDHGHSGTATNWDDRHVNYSGYFNAGDTISLQVYHQNFTSYGYQNGPVYTKLAIKKLN